MNNIQVSEEKIQEVFDEESQKTVYNQLETAERFGKLDEEEQARIDWAIKECQKIVDNKTEARSSRAFFKSLQLTIMRTLKVSENQEKAITEHDRKRQEWLESRDEDIKGFIKARYGY